MKDKSKKSTYSTTFGVDPSLTKSAIFDVERGILKLLPKTQKNRNPKMVAGFKWWSR